MLRLWSFIANMSTLDEIIAEEFVKVVNGESDYGTTHTAAAKRS